MSLFRCYRCNAPFGYEFEADQPACPQCRAEPPAVVRLTPVHWLAPGGGPIRGTEGGDYRLCCAPDRTLTPGLMATGQPDAVTCPRCKADATHQAALAQWREYTQGG